PSLRKADNGGDDAISLSTPCHPVEDRIFTDLVGSLGSSPLEAPLYPLQKPSCSLWLKNCTLYHSRLQPQIFCVDKPCLTQGWLIPIKNGSKKKQHTKICFAIPPFPLRLLHASVVKLNPLFTF